MSTKRFGKRCKSLVQMIGARSAEGVGFVVRKPGTNIFLRPKTTKPQAGSWGLDVAGGLPLRWDCLLAHRGRYWTTPVKSTPMRSGTLDGATTRRNPLNLDRGGGPLDAQRVVGKREPHQDLPGKSSQQRDGSDSHPTPHDLDLGAFRLNPVRESPTVIPKTSRFQASRAF